MFDQIFNQTFAPALTIPAPWNMVTFAWVFLAVAFGSLFSWYGCRGRPLRAWALRVSAGFFILAAALGVADALTQTAWWTMGAKLAVVVMWSIIAKVTLRRANASSKVATLMDGLGMARLSERQWANAALGIIELQRLGVPLEGVTVHFSRPEDMPD